MGTSFSSPRGGESHNESSPHGGDSHKESSPCGEESHNEGYCFSCYMKEGECKETFIKWDECVKQGKKEDEDIVNKCFEVTSDLRKCMEANQDHYGEFLQAEKEPGYKLLSSLKQQGAFEDGELEKAEKDIPFLKLVMNLQAQKEADEIRRKKSPETKN
ncbi:GCK [Artemisia annua]|uniref:GCK n=1 Tax=Artemisia annua TaxID=35608 RepID=A0A2U1LAY2_ARTAN|nr:GCK [Artemisia annua]